MSGQLVVFQGDSITDVGRRDDPEGLGEGYVRTIAHRLPNVRVLNLGISGDRVSDLAGRWDTDTLASSPDVVSILVGINDVWHQRDGGDAVPLHTFAASYRQLLKRTLAALPSVRLVICEPFALLCGVVDAGWFPDLDERRAAIRALAGERGATFVPLQTSFDDAVAGGLRPEDLVFDGVHPTVAGHALIAEAWLGTVGTE